MNNNEENLKLEKLRTNALKDADELGKKMRHGLFSQPPPLSIGNKHYSIGKRKVDEDGKVIVNKKGIYTNPIKKGKDRTVYLDKEYLKNPDEQIDTYLSTVDVANLLKKNDILKMKKGDEDRTKFYPIVSKWSMYETNDKKKRFGNPYENMPEDPIKIKKILFDENKKVWTKNPNIRTNPMKKGKYNTTIGHLFNNYKYLNQGYDGLRKIEYLDRQKLNEYNKKIERTQFKPASLTGGCLSTDKQLYGLKKDLPHVSKLKKKKIDFNKDKEPFKPSNPSRKGYQGLLDNKFKYIEHQGLGKLNQQKNKIIIKENNHFYPATISKSRPTPSITLINCRLK